MTWTSRTTSAQWAARAYHTSVIDAAGAIYVIGGFVDGLFGATGYKDVWASPNGGARAGLGKGDGRGILRGGTQGVLQGY